MRHIENFINGDDNPIIVKMTFGSHLYGTANESSDKDFKGIFMPSKEQILLGRIPKSLTFNTKKDNGSKNSPDDVDTELYSLHYFIDLACKGETVAMDMLHAPKEALLETSDIWDAIIAERERFYTKNLNAFVGYARRQAGKYGIKGSRLNDAKRVLDFIQDKSLPFIRLVKLKDGEIWDALPDGEHIFKHEPDENGIRMYEVCGRKCGETSTLEYLGKMVKHFYDAYGARAEQAAKNEGIDWKAVSHAFRAAFQIKEILTKGTITFPLEEAEFLRQVKEGKLHYRDEIAPKLDALMDEVEALSAKSDLPERADREYWDGFIVRQAESEILKDTRTFKDTNQMSFPAVKYPQSRKR